MANSYDYKHHIGAALWPWINRCLLCGGASQTSLSLCAACINDMPRNTHACTYCAEPLEGVHTICAQCSQKHPPWQGVWVPFCYRWPLDVLERRYKFYRQLSAGFVLAHLWCRHPPPRLPELIVPVPLHIKRLRQRGYDQALELAKIIGKNCQVPLSQHVLVRQHATQAQSELDAKARRKNVRHAFALHPRASSLPDHIALFDDVMTTGATLGACARVLQQAGVKRIDVWALARVPKPGIGW